MTRPSTASRSSGSRAAAQRSSSRAAGSCTASGCVARTAAWTRASSCALLTRGSAAWARQRSPSAPGANYPPPARRCANVPSRRSTSSPRRRRKSPGSRRGGVRTQRSPPSCSSARAPSNTTCTKYSRSLESVHAESSGGRFRARGTPLCPPSPSGLGHQRQPAGVTTRPVQTGSPEHLKATAGQPGPALMAAPVP